MWNLLLRVGKSKSLLEVSKKEEGEIRDYGELPVNEK